MQQTQVKEKGQELRTRIENYLRVTGKKQLNPEAIEHDCTKLLEEGEANLEDLNTSLQELNRDVFVQLLLQRQDLNEDEANNIVSQLESKRDSVFNRLRESQEQATAKANELRQRVENYLQNTNKEELNPEGIKRDFRILLEDPQAGISLIRSRLSQFDPSGVQQSLMGETPKTALLHRDTLVQLLSQRQDLSEDQVNQVLDQLEAVRDSILQVPKQAKEQYEQTTTAIAEYLRNINLEKLDPEGIKRDLETLLNDPREGALALRIDAFALGVTAG